MSTSTRFASSPEIYFDPETIGRFGFRVVMMILVAGLVVVFVGCCSPVALEHAKDLQSSNKGHMDDERASPQVRKLGQVNYDAAAVLVEILGGDSPDADTQARIDASKPKPTEGGEGQ